MPKQKSDRKDKHKPKAEDDGEKKPGISKFIKKAPKGATKLKKEKNTY